MTGDYLGDLTNELPPGRYIKSFCSSGPKNYAYKLDNGEEVCKVKGFTLNFKNSQLINFEAIKGMVTQGKGGKTIRNEHKISRNMRTREVYNRVEEKTFSLVYTKRVIQPDLTTVPFDY